MSNENKNLLIDFFYLPVKSSPVSKRRPNIKSFARLEGLCRSKGIICERAGKKIELTLGGTTGIYDSVRDALDGYRNEHPFCDAPVKL